MQIKKRVARFLFDYCQFVLNVNNVISHIQILVKIKNKLYICFSQNVKINCKRINIERLFKELYDEIK